MISITINFNNKSGDFEWCGYSCREIATLIGLINTLLPSAEKKEYFILEKGEEND